jgi:hypothetical protein
VSINLGKNKRIHFLLTQEELGKLDNIIREYSFNDKKNYKRLDFLNVALQNLFVLIEENPKLLKEKLNNWVNYKNGK